MLSCLKVVIHYLSLSIMICLEIKGLKGFCLVDFFPDISIKRIGSISVCLESELPSPSLSKE